MFGIENLIRYAPTVPGSLYLANTTKRLVKFTLPEKACTIEQYQELLPQAVGTESRNINLN